MKTANNTPMMSSSPIQRAVAEVEPLSPQAVANADMTHNSAADISDASVIQRYLAEYTADLG